MALDVMVVGGTDGVSTQDFAMYSPILNKWWQFSDDFVSNPTPYQDSFMWVYNDKLYAMGGLSSGGSPVTQALLSVDLPTVWQDASYNPSWTNHGTLPGGIEQGRGATVIVNGNVHCFGGTEENGVLDESDISRYVALTSLPTTTWTGTGDLALAVTAIENDGAAVGNIIYRGGGAWVAAVPTDTFEALDTDDYGSGWGALAVIPTAVHSHSMVSDGTYIYVVGGTGNTTGVQRYDIGADSWTAFSNPMPGGIEADPVFYYDGTIYAMASVSAIYTYPVADGTTGAWSTIVPIDNDTATFGANWQRAAASTGGSGGETTPVGGLTLQGPFTPVRANARMDALSAARNFTAPPIDINISQSFLPEPLETIPADILTGFDEALTPGTIEFYYTPLGRQSREYLQEFTGETMLARMSRSYPASAMNLVSEITAPIITGNIEADGTVEARYLIEYVFQLWATQFIWFDYVRSVPDLRIPILNATYTGDEGKVYSNVVTIAQDDDAERTMLDLLQELLAPFGAFKTVNDSNEIVIRPRYGPDADSSPILTLKDNDVYSLSTGDPSRVGTKNRITIEKKPYEQAADTPAMQDAYYQLRSGLWNPVTVPMITDRLATPPDAMPGSRLDLTAGIGSHQFSGYGRGSPLLWPPVSSTFPEDEVNFTSSASASPPSTVQLDVDFKSYDLNGPGVTIEKNLSDGEVSLAGLTDLPTDGMWYTLFTAQYVNSAPFTMHLTLDGRWVNEPGRRGIELKRSSSNLFSNHYVKGVTYTPNPMVGMFAITLSDASTVWTARGTQTTVTFGVITGDSPDTILAPDGTNAIKNSQDARGILEETINIGPYNPSLEQMQLMAEGLVLDKIQPRSIRIAEQSVVRAHPVRFEHVGRLVALPDADEGIVTSRDYAEQAAYPGVDGALSSTIEVMTPIVGESGEVDGDANPIQTTLGGNFTTTAGLMITTTDN